MPCGYARPLRLLTAAVRAAAAAAGPTTLARMTRRWVRDAPPPPKKNSRQIVDDDDRCKGTPAAVHGARAKGSASVAPAGGGCRGALPPGPGRGEAPEAGADQSAVSFSQQSRSESLSPRSLSAAESAVSFRVSPRLSLPVSTQSLRFQVSPRSSLFQSDGRRSLSLSLGLP